MPGFLETVDVESSTEGFLRIYTVMKLVTEPRPKGEKDSACV